MNFPKTVAAIDEASATLLKHFDSQERSDFLMIRLEIAKVTNTLLVEAGLTGSDSVTTGNVVKEQ
jgi:hypothetical protein